MNRQFIIGERVAAYNHRGRFVGHIEDFDKTTGNLLIQNQWFHPKQLVKLVRKMKRRIWINLLPSGPFQTSETLPDYRPTTDNWVEFMEIKRK